MDYVKFINCGCYFCDTGKPHPANHIDFGPSTGRLLKAESLDPKDVVPIEGCWTCGHLQVAERN